MLTWETSPPLPSIIGEYRTRVTYLGKDQNSNCASTECISLLHHGKVQKSLSQTILSWGWSVCLIPTPRINWRRASAKPNLTAETFFVPSQLWHGCCKHVLQECGFPSSSYPPTPGSDARVWYLGQLSWTFNFQQCCWFICSVRYLYLSHCTTRYTCKSRNPNCAHWIVLKGSTGADKTWENQW